MAKTSGPYIIKPDVVEIRSKIVHIRTRKIRRHTKTHYLVIKGEDAENIPIAPIPDIPTIDVERRLLSGTTVDYGEDILMRARFLIAFGTDISLSKTTQPQVVSQILITESTNTTLFKTNQPDIAVERSLNGGTDINSIGIDP